jgi:hypothetical protein
VLLHLHPGGEGYPAKLQFEAPGRAPLESLLLSETEAGHWTFHHRQPGLALDGSVTATGNDLLVTLESGEVTFAGMPLTLGSASLLFVGGSPE